MPDTIINPKGMGVFMKRRTFIALEGMIQTLFESAVNNVQDVINESDEIEYFDGDRLMQEADYIDKLQRIKSQLDFAKENEEIEYLEPNLKFLKGDFTKEDFELIEQVKRAIKEKEKVGCTGCRYCMPCPKGVDIPGTFLCYNTMFTESKSNGRFQYAQTVGLTKEPAFATQCIECGKCERHCPQEIPIREKLKEADKALRPLPFKVGINVARKYMFREKKK